MKTKKREYVDAQILRTILNKHIRFCDKLTHEQNGEYNKGLINGRRVEAQHILKEISILHTEPTYLMNQKLSTNEIREILKEIESDKLRKASDKIVKIVSESSSEKPYRHIHRFVRKYKEENRILHNGKWYDRELLVCGICGKEKIQTSLHKQKNG